MPGGIHSSLGKSSHASFCWSGSITPATIRGSSFLLLPARSWQENFSLEDGTSNCRSQGPRGEKHKVPQWVMGKMVSRAVPASTAWSRAGVHVCIGPSTV